MSPADSRATYRVLSRFYDLFDLIFLLGGRGNPRSGLVSAVGDENARILDVCVGTAASSIPVAAQLKGARIVGIDRSDDMLAVARRKIEGLGLPVIELVNANAEAIPFGDGAFDVAMVSFALHEFEPESLDRAFGEIARVLKPGGRLCVIDFARQDGLANRCFLAVWTLIEPPCFRGFLDLDWRNGIESCGLRFESATEYSFSNLYVLRKPEPASASPA
jgi:demethylmenaquinone methyltransferase/2-methoxy-6-polyprenyl-1,4-benzoquinol methylase